MALPVHVYCREKLKLGPESTEIHVKNLAAHATIGQDPWGREGRLFRQPVFVSVRVSLSSPFESASSQDQVTSSTVNYSTLSKAILAAVEENEGVHELGIDVVTFMDVIVRRLTGCYPGRDIPDRSQTQDAPRIVLDPGALRELELKITLPKGSLLSNTTSITRSILYDSNYSIPGYSYYSSVLRLEDIRVPTIIGINDNERTAKQWVIATVEVEPYDNVEGHDVYVELEQIVFKTIEESSFQTLEALAEHIVGRIISLFVCAYSSIFEDTLPKQIPAGEPYGSVRVHLEKPTAVTFADSPVVEVVRGFGKTPREDGLRGDDLPNVPVVPFPLQGSLGDWLQHNFPKA